MVNFDGIVHCFCIVRRDQLHSNRSQLTYEGNVDDTLRFAIDYDLFAKFMKANAKFVRVNRFLGVFREHEAAKTSQLLNTVGAAEVAKTREKYDIRLNQWAPFISARFYYAALRNGEAFACHRKQLPGCLPGVGYDYNDVWGGLLDEGRLPVSTDVMAL